MHPDAAPDAQHVVFGQKVHIDAGELLQGTGGAVGIAGIHGHPAAGVAQVVAAAVGAAACTRELTLPEMGGVSSAGASGRGRRGSAIQNRLNAMVNTQSP